MQSTAQLRDLESRPWSAADKLWANTGLKPSEFSTHVLGLIFLRYAERRFHEVEAGLLGKGIAASEIEPFDYKAEGALYLPENARFAYLADLPEGEAIGKAINDAMADDLIENNTRRIVIDLCHIYDNYVGEGKSAFDAATANWFSGQLAGVGDFL